MSPLLVGSTTFTNFFTFVVLLATALPCLSANPSNNRSNIQEETVNTTTHHIFPECPDDHPNRCLTLSHVARNTSAYLFPNTKLVFHSGDHILAGYEVTVANITNLTFGVCEKCMEHSVIPPIRIVCNQTAHFLFSGVRNLQIHFITFVSCPTALASTTAQFHSCSFENSTSVSGGALSTYKQSFVMITGKTKFVNNNAHHLGGAFLVHQSNVFFSGETLFYNNKASTGGALFIDSYNTVNFTGNITLVNNSALTGEYKVQDKGRELFSGGGALHIYRNNIVYFDGNTNFERNSVKSGFGGGAIQIFYNNNIRFSGSTNFNGNTASENGGALIVGQYNNVSFLRTSNFHDNNAVIGGALYVYYRNTLSFDGKSGFYSNVVPDRGGAIYAYDKNSIRFNGTSTFVGNSANYRGGGVFLYENNNLNIDGNTSYHNNTSDLRGGALCAFRSNKVSFNGNSSFHLNRGTRGGAVYAYESNSVYFNGNITFYGNGAAFRGGAISSLKDNIFTLAGLTYFIENSAQFGGALYAGRNTTVLFVNNSTFSRNSGNYGGGIFIHDGRLSMNVANAVFSKNTAIQRNTRPGGVEANGNHLISKSGYGGAFHIASSTVTLRGNYVFSENMANFGGGIAFTGHENRYLILEEDTQLEFLDNVALSRGGAIYIEDDPFTYCINDGDLSTVRNHCFFQIYKAGDCILVNKDPHVTLPWTIKVRFSGNTAKESGNVIYGGNLGTCGVCTNGPVYTYWVGLTALENIARNVSLSSSNIASDPIKVCHCEDSSLMPMCDEQSRQFSVILYPGQTLSLHVASVGQLNGQVPSLITAVPDKVQIPTEYLTQATRDNTTCTELRYPVKRVNKEEIGSATLKLYSSEPCSTSSFPFQVTITFRECPAGFSLTYGECMCTDRLKKYTQECNIHLQTVTRQSHSSFWIGAVVMENNSSKSDGIILSSHCPFDYCTDEAINITLNATDKQCQNGRSGLLCGECQSGYSLALGSSRCLSDCSNKSLSLVLVFAAAGIFLVFILFMCNLTVAEGSLSGLLFYANLFTINQSMLLPTVKPNILTVFISWLNMDVGIETCFSSGLDKYTKTWLQFVFPVYIWLLVLLVVILARHSTTVAKLISTSNPIAVLATLILLSYTKLVRTTMIAFSFTTLTYPEGETFSVWLYDGNVQYFSDKHLALFILSFIVFLTLFLPYTLFLLCGQWLQGKFQPKHLPPKLKLYMNSFLDVHYAPYKDNHRYWIGLLLVVRFLLLFVSTVINIGSPQDPHINLLVMIVVLSVLLAWVSHGVYKKWYLNILEASFLFNLITLSAGTYQVFESGGSQRVLVYTSITITLVLFVVIFATAVLCQFMKTKCGHSIALKLRRAQTMNETVQSEEPLRNEHSNVTTTTVDIRNIRDSVSVECREPVLEMF